MDGGKSMNTSNMFKVGTRLQRLLLNKSVRNGRTNIKSNLSPTKTLYLWEKHSIRRIELFGME